MDLALPAPPRSFEERIKDWLIPPALDIRRRFRRERRRGEREIGLLPHLCDPARISLDVGANRGVYAFGMLPFSREVHAFEPNPKMLRSLKRWTGSRVVVHPLALSDRAGQAELRIPRGRHGLSNQGASLAGHRAAGPHLAIPVETARLDDLGLSGIGFIKIDVEGHEEAVLAGASATIARDRPVLLIEIEERHTGRDLTQMVAGVRARGYGCLAMPHGRLVRFEQLDLERHHRRPASRRDYVFNFIFLPEG